MTPDQQRETALHLYRLVWRFPERAPEPKDGSDGYGADGFGADAYTPYYVKAGIIFVEVSVLGINHARVVVIAGRNKLVIKGTPGYVETMLRAVPYSLRPHVGGEK